MTSQLSPIARQQFFDNNGNPLAFGLLYTYAAGTTTPQATYVDSTQTTPNTNPVVLDFRGSCALWLDPFLSYKFLLTDSSNAPIPGWPVDNVSFSLQFSSLDSSTTIGVTPNSDPQGPLVVFAGGSAITSHEGGTIRIGTEADPLVNSGVNSAQFSLSVVTDGSNAPGGPVEPQVQLLLARNVSANTGALTYALEAGNDKIGQELIIGTTSSTFNVSPPVFTAGPVTQFKFINTITNVPLIVGSGGVATMILTNNSISGYGPHAGAQIDMTADSGVIVFTPTGMTGPSPATITAVWSRNGNQVMIYLPFITGTSNANSFTLTGTFSASLQPIRTQCLAVSPLIDNGTETGGSVQVGPAMSSLIFFKGGSPSGWTSTGTKGIFANVTFSYLLV